MPGKGAYKIVGSVYVVGKGEGECACVCVWGGDALGED